MSSLLKSFLVLAVVLPVSAYVFGSLVASSTDRPDERAPVVLLDAPSADQDESKGKKADGKSGKKAENKPAKHSGPGSDDDGTSGNNSGGGSEGDDSPKVKETQPAVVATPKPTPVDDDWDDDDDERDETDDSDDRTDDDRSDD